VNKNEPFVEASIPIVTATLANGFVIIGEILTDSDSNN
jgi:ligand-binding sensor protein